MWVPACGVSAITIPFRHKAIKDYLSGFENLASGYAPWFNWRISPTIWLIGRVLRSSTRGCLQQLRFPGADGSDQDGLIKAQYLQQDSRFLGSEAGLNVRLHPLGNRLYRNHLSFIKDLAPEIGRGVRITYSLRFF